MLERFTRDFEGPREHDDGSLVAVDTAANGQEQLGNLFKQLVQINLEAEHEYG